MKMLWKGFVGCLTLIGFVIVVGMIAILFIFGNSSKKISPSDNVVKVAENTTATIEETSETEEVHSTFNLIDTSDETIESIVTYGDYLDMYEAIVNEYITNYDLAIQQYGLSDSATYQQMKAQVTTSIEQQKQQYGPMKNAKIIGKEGIVEFLKNYRNDLKTLTDNLAGGF